MDEPTTVKIKLVLIALALLGGLYAANRWLGAKREYIAGVPAAGSPGTGQERERLTVGFLPVT